MAGTLKKALILILVAAATAAMTACSTTGAKNHTLLGNSTFPANSIAAYYDKEKWDDIKNLPYSAYVIISASPGAYNSLKNLRVVENYPDSTRDEIAVQYAQGLPVSSVSTVSSRVPPQIDVYVIFYDRRKGGQAVVYAKQKESISVTRSVGGIEYLRVCNY